MLRNILIGISLLFIVGCSSIPTTIVQKETLTPKEVAKCMVPALGELPPPLDLSEYKVARGSYILYNNGKTYIGIPEAELTDQQLMLLQLKNRIYELQQIIIDTNELNKNVNQ